MTVFGGGNFDSESTLNSFDCSIPLEFYDNFEDKLTIHYIDLSRINCSVMRISVSSYGRRSKRGRVSADPLAAGTTTACRRDARLAPLREPTGKAAVSATRRIHLEGGKAGGSSPSLTIEE